MTTIFDISTINLSELDFGSLAFGQIPVLPAYPFPPSTSAQAVYSPIPSLLQSASLDQNGLAINTNGDVFDGIEGFQVLPFVLTGSLVPFTPQQFFEANSGTGYAGFTNYTIDFEGVDLSNINSIMLQSVDPNFPTLDLEAGVTIEFQVQVTEEVSPSTRAGFSLLAVSSDSTRAIELGFSANGEAEDTIFAQNFDLDTPSEGETYSAEGFSIGDSTLYQLSLKSTTYRLAANGVAILSGDLRDYVFTPANSNPPFPESANPYETPNLLFLGDNTDQAYAQFTLGDVSVLPLANDLTAEQYDDYIASHPDLIQAFGYNLGASQPHFDQLGWDEGRQADAFSEALYLASHPDLIQAFGHDLDAATQHYIEYGFFEQRATGLFNPRLYLDTYLDLQEAFGDDTDAATRHYIELGYVEGRDQLLGFEPLAYIASSQDLVNALGDDPEAGRLHYILDGFDEGRRATFQPDDYIASYGDLIQVFGYNLEGGSQHYINFGATEGRAQDTFDEATYLSNYPDLQNAYGTDTEAATRHFIEFGFAEGRVDTPIG